MYKEEAVGLLKDHKKMQEIDEALDKLNKETSEQLNFIKKKAEQIHNNNNKQKEKLWQDIKNYAQDAGLLPDWYSDEHHGIAINRGAICIMDRRNRNEDEGSFLNFMKAMVEGRAKIESIDIEPSDD